MMIVECQTCPVRELHCADCVVTALTQLPFPTSNESPAPHRLGVVRSRDTPGTCDSPGAGPTTQDSLYLPDSVVLDRAERRAVSILAAVGLVDHDTASHARAVLETGRQWGSAPVPDGQRRAI